MPTSNDVRKKVVLYTHQKQKKAKTWHDGSIKHSGHGNKGVLYDEKGARLDSIYIKIQDLTVGEQIESDRYLILIEELKKAAQKQENVKPPVKEVPVSVSQKPHSQARCAGLKRRLTGFVPPRMVKEQFDTHQNDNLQDTSNNIHTQVSNGYLKTLRSNFIDRNPLNNTLNQGARVPDGNNQNNPAQDFSDVNSSLPVPNNDKSRHSMLSIYSQLGQNGSSSRESSQESDNRTSAQLLSPWSVYGSNTSSPSLKLSQSPNIHKNPGFLRDSKSNSLSLGDRNSCKDNSQSDINTLSQGFNSPNMDEYHVRLSQNGLSSLSSPSSSPLCLKSSEFKSLGERKNVQSAYENHRHFEPSCAQPLKCLKVDKEAIGIENTGTSNNLPAKAPATCQASLRKTTDTEVGSSGLEKMREGPCLDIQPKRSMTQILSLLRGKAKTGNYEKKESTKFSAFLNDTNKKPLIEGEGKENVCNDSQDNSVLKKSVIRIERHIESSPVVNCNLDFNYKNSLNSTEDTISSNNKGVSDISESLIRESVLLNSENLNVRNESVVADVKSSPQEHIVKAIAKDSMNEIIVQVSNSMKSIETEPDVHTKSRDIFSEQPESQILTSHKSSTQSYLEHSQVVKSKILSSCEQTVKSFKFSFSCGSQVKSPKLASSCETTVNSPKLSSSCEPNVSSLKLSSSCEPKQNCPKFPSSCESDVNHSKLSSKGEAKTVSPKKPYGSETHVKSLELLPCHEPELDDSFGDFSLTFSPVSKNEDNDVDTETCLYEIGDVPCAGGEKTDDTTISRLENVDHQEYHMKSKAGLHSSDVSQSPGISQILHQDNTGIRLEASPSQSDSQIDGKQYIGNNLEVNHTADIKSQEQNSECPDCSNPLLMCTCDSCKKELDDVAQIELKAQVGNKKITPKTDTDLVDLKDNTRDENKKILSAYDSHRHLQPSCTHPTNEDTDSITERTNKDCVSMRMYEEGDSQATCMTVDTLEFSCDATDTQSMLTLEDIEKCQKTQQSPLVYNLQNKPLVYEKTVNSEVKNHADDEEIMFDNFHGKRPINAENCPKEPVIKYNAFRRNQETFSVSNNQVLEATDHSPNFGKFPSDDGSFLWKERRQEGLNMNRRSNRLDRRRTALGPHKDDFVPQGLTSFEEDEDPLGRTTYKCVSTTQSGFPPEFASERNDRPGTKDMSAMISARLGGYRMTGSLSAAASRKSAYENNEDTPIQQKLESRILCDSKTYLGDTQSPIQTLYNDGLGSYSQITPEEQQCSENTASPFQHVPDGDDEIYNRLYQARLMYSRGDRDSNLTPLNNSPLVPTGYSGSDEASQQFDSPNSLMYSPRHQIGQKEMKCRQEVICVDQDIDITCLKSDSNFGSEFQVKEDILRGENRKSIFDAMDRGRMQVENDNLDKRIKKCFEEESSPDVSQATINSNDYKNKTNINSANSKWEEYIASDCSDENEIDLKQYQSKTGVCRDYSVIEKPADIIDRLTQAQCKIALCDAEMSYTRQVEKGNTDILDVCEKGNTASDDLHEQSKTDNAICSFGYVNSDKEASEVSIDKTKPNNDLTPSFASTDSFDELFVEGECDFDIDVDTIKENDTRGLGIERGPEFGIESPKELNTTGKVTNNEIFDTVSADIKNTDDLSERDDSEWPSSANTKSLNKPLDTKIDVANSIDNDDVIMENDNKTILNKETESENADTEVDNLDESLQLSPPVFGGGRLKSVTEERKTADLINSNSLRKETYCKSLVEKSKGNKVASTENSPDITSGSRCLRILSKMKIGQKVPRFPSEKDIAFNNNGTENINILGNVEQPSHLTERLSTVANNTNDIVIDLPCGNDSGIRKTTNNHYNNFQQNSTISSAGKGLNSKFKAPDFTKGEIRGNPNAQKVNISKKFVAPTMVRNVPPQSSMQTGRTGVSPRASSRPEFGNTTGESVSSSQLHFPCRSLVDQVQNVRRQAVIPDRFPSVNLYKQVLTAALTEFINCQLREVAKGYYHALSRVDMTSFTAGTDGGGRSSTSAGTPVCQCGAQSKVIMVKKQGANQGRYFYACNASNRNQQCKFFQWADENSRGGQGKTSSKRVIKDANGLNLFMKDSRVHFYGESQLMIRTKDNIAKYFKAPKWVRNRGGEADTIQKKQIVLKLPYKGHSSLYAKDDLWVVSRNLDFTAGSTFIARSTYHGPTSGQEVEIEPLVGYSPSNWPNNSLCHALLAGNASSELSCMENIREHILPASPPIVTQLLNRKNEDLVERTSGGYKAPRIMPGRQREFSVLLPCEQMDELSQTYIQQYHLNVDQAEAVRRVANMFSAEKNDQLDGILLIHGVFGAGKSYLLSVVVLFLVCVFELLADMSREEGSQWKLLISSTTNVAVDRILSGLLDLGFEDFVRVGSVKKISKSVLPYSVHATGTDSQELRDLQEMLRSGELTVAEKSNVRKSIEKHRCGENKKKLSRVRVVGATCAACSLSCLNGMEFPLVLLDECSQMTEPTSLLPIAKFSCRNLILVGDPKQLAPTIQSVEAAHNQGLEQTMFDRLLIMGHMPTLLRTQYRCHPRISSLANNLFYGGMLENGVTENDRQPLLDFLPTLCVYSVDHGQESCEGAGSYYNEEEAQFVVFLLQVLLSEGLEPSVLGVITLYRAQMARIMDLLAVGGCDTDMKGIQVSTVDAFQGGERDVVILSCVRTHNCGFIDSDKRMNVALTRARHHLLIVGHHGNLSKSILWGKVINHCKAFENGLQSSKEARTVLQKCMEEFDHQRVEAIESSTSLPASGSSGTGRQKARGKKRKSTQEEPTSQSSAVDSDKDTVVNKRRKVPRKKMVKQADPTASTLVEDSIPGEGHNTDFSIQDQAIQIITPSPDLEISDKEADLSLQSSCKSIEETHRQPVRPKHSARLKPVIFDSDSDSDLPEISL